MLSHPPRMGPGPGVGGEARGFELGMHGRGGRGGPGRGRGFGPQGRGRGRGREGDYMMREMPHHDGYRMNGRPLGHVERLEDVPVFLGKMPWRWCFDSVHLVRGYDGRAYITFVVVLPRTIVRVLVQARTEFVAR